MHILPILGGIAAAGVAVAVLRELAAMMKHKVEEGDYVLITGSGSGIGLATAKHLDKRGFRVIATVRRPEQVEVVRAGASERMRVLVLDVTSEESIATFLGVLKTIVGENGLSGVVLNAGVMLGGPAEFMSTERTRQIFETNFFGAVRCVRAFLPLLRERWYPGPAGGKRTRRRRAGRIVSISSVVGAMPCALYSSYCASKGALEAFTDSLRRELAPQGLFACCVRPGTTRTRLLRDLPLDYAAAHTAKALGSEARRDEYERLYRSQEVKTGKQLAVLSALAGPPEPVAAAVDHALTSWAPRTYYNVGWDTPLMAALSAAFPACLVEAAMGVALPFVQPLLYSAR
eukprot:tig00000448_g919.t1